MPRPRVLITGVFDVLHEEHVKFLLEAKKLGTLIVGIESDQRVRQLKGNNRPINAAPVRMQNLLDLGIADEVLVLPKNFDRTPQHRAFLKLIQPNILAMSSHTSHLRIKSRLMQEIGGRVEIVHQHNPDVSTSKLLGLEID